MPRIVFVIIFIIVALIPVGVFNALSQPGDIGQVNNNDVRGHTYHRGPSFFYLRFGNGWMGRTYSQSSGRSYSSGGFRGGGPGFGK